MRVPGRAAAPARRGGLHGHVRHLRHLCSVRGRGEPMTDPQEPIKDEKIVILDRGNVELAIPRDWSVKLDPEGYMKVEDLTELCLLEVSYLRLAMAASSRGRSSTGRSALQADPRGQARADIHHAEFAGSGGSSIQSSASASSGLSSIGAGGSVRISALHQRKEDRK